MEYRESSGFGLRRPRAQSEQSAELLDELDELDELR